MIIDNRSEFQEIISVKLKSLNISVLYYIFFINLKIRRDASKTLYYLVKI